MLVALESKIYLGIKLYVVADPLTDAGDGAGLNKENRHTQMYLGSIPSKIPRSSPVVKKTPLGNAANRGPPVATQLATKVTTTPMVSHGSPCEFPAATAAMNVTPRSKSRKNTLKMRHEAKAVVPFSEVTSLSSRLGLSWWVC